MRRARHGYYAAISYVDERIGRGARGAATRRASRDDTIVVFTADHGEMLGERGLWYKMAFFEQSARVPLVVSAPGRFAAGRVATPVSGSTSRRRCSTCAALAAAAALDGRSLAPAAARGAPADAARRRRVPGRGRERARGDGAPRRAGSTSGARADPELLYDLEADPRELCDVAAGPPALAPSCAPRSSGAGTWPR